MVWYSVYWQLSLDCSPSNGIAQLSGKKNLINVQKVRLKKCGLRLHGPIVARFRPRKKTRPNKPRPKAERSLGRVFRSYGRVFKTRPQNLFFVVTPLTWIRSPYHQYCSVFLCESMGYILVWDNFQCPYHHLKLVLKLRNYKVCWVPRYIIMLKLRNLFSLIKAFRIKLQLPIQ